MLSDDIYMSITDTAKPHMDSAYEQLEVRLFELESELESQRQRVEDLGVMGAMIASNLEIESALTVMMDMAIREVAGEVGGILLDSGGALTARVAWGLDRGVLEMVEPLPGRTIESLYSDITEATAFDTTEHTALAGAHITSALVAPIRSSGRAHGLVVILNKEGAGGFDDIDCATLGALANFLAVAIENAQLLAESLEKQRLDHELEIAHQVQETILPETGLAFPGVSIGVVYVPARHVGGDFYEVLPAGTDRFALVIGDVSNKGVPASLVMSAAAGIIKSALRICPEIGVAKLAEHLNDTLSEGIVKDKGMFATIWFGVFDMGARVLSYCNAGHIPPILKRAVTGELRELAVGGPIIGQFGGLCFKEEQVALAHGDSLTLCTDGLTEAANSKDELFGRERLRAIVAQSDDLSAQGWCEAMKARIDRYTRGAASDEMSDDFTVIKIHVDREGKL